MSGQLTDVGIYISTSILGALLATPSCRLIQGYDCCSNEGEV